MRMIQKAWALIDHLNPRRAHNARVISLADRELMRKRVEEEERQEMLRIEAKRKDIMRIVMSAKKPPEPKETTRYIVVDQDGQLVQTLEMERRS